MTGFRTISSDRLIDWEKITKLPENTEDLITEILPWTNISISRVWSSVVVNSLWWPAVVTDWFNRNYFVATEWQTEFTANFDFTENTWSVIVALNWQILKPTLDYTEPWLNKVVFVSWLNAWDEVQLLTGIKWDKGDKWDKWDKWDQWIQWEVWPQWIQGIQWLKWEKGDKWDKGDQWIQGIQWPAGADWANWIWTVASVSSWNHITVNNTDPNNPIINYNWELFSTILKNKLDWIEVWAEVNNISDINATDLTDWWDTSLHSHDWRYYTETETNTLLSWKANLSWWNTFNWNQTFTQNIRQLKWDTETKWYEWSDWSVVYWFYRNLDEHLNLNIGANNHWFRSNWQVWIKSFPSYDLDVSWIIRSTWNTYVWWVLWIWYTSPTATLHLKAWTAAANTAPLKLTAWVKLTTPEDWAIEYDGTHYYGTIWTTRVQLDQTITTWWLTYSAINSSQAITNWNYYWVTCTGDITLTLADWTSSGQNLSIKKLDNTSYTITITGNIEWETSIVMDTQYESLDLFWNWTYYLIK